MKKQEFLESMIDFKSAQTMTDAELSAWAQEKWSQLLKTDYWQERDNQDYIRLFVRYFGHYVPEISGESTDQSG